MRPFEFNLRDRGLLEKASPPAGQDRANPRLSPPQPEGDRLAAPPRESSEYERGYLAGVADGINHGTAQINQIIELLKGDA